MSEPAPNQFALLKTRRFLPLFLGQFLGAFNDQVYQKAFVALITYRLADQVGIPIALLGVIASGLFILPFALITPSAGQLADRHDKAVLMRWIKAWEIVVMGLAIVGFYTQNIYFLYFVLFLMGAQSAMFAPIKYSVLPQYLAPSELMGGNGLVQGFTFLAIVFGTILGNEMILREAGEVIDLLVIAITLPMDGVALISTAVVTIAVIGFISSLFTPPAMPVMENPPPVDWFFPRAIYKLYAMCRQNKPAMRAILAISWFWFLGATFLSLLPAYAKEDLGVDEGVLTVLLAGFSIGVAVGAVASEGLSQGKVDVNLPPIGALGLAIMAVELYLATPPPPAEGAALIGRAEFLDSFTGWRILVDFIILAAFAGMYVTPLNAVLQAEAPDDKRASYIACSNVTDASFMVVSAAVVAVLVAFGIGTTEVLVIITLTGLPMAFAVGRYAPATRLGRLALSIWPRGPQ